MIGHIPRLILLDLHAVLTDLNDTLWTIIYLTEEHTNGIWLFIAGSNIQLPLRISSWWPDSYFWCPRGHAWSGVVSLRFFKLHNKKPWNYADFSEIMHQSPNTRLVFSHNPYTLVGHTIILLHEKHIEIRISWCKLVPWV